MSRNYGIAGKLAVAIALFLAPMAILSYYLYSSQQIAIDFADKEGVGNEYLTVLRQVQSDMLAVGRGETGPKPADLAATIAKGEQDFGAGMESTDQVKAVTDALGSKPEDAGGALRGLIARIGDKSNLILDPDLDSYYTMDLVLIKAPDLADKIADLSSYAREHGANATPVLKEVADFLKKKGALDDVVGGAQASLAAAYDDNDKKDRYLRDTVDAKAQDMFKAITALTGGLENTTLAGGTEPINADDLRAKEKAAQDALKTFTDSSAVALGKLFEKRTAGFVAERLTAFGCSGLFFILACVSVVFFIRRSVIRPIGMLTGIMGRLAEDDTNLTVGLTERSDELGAMAQAVERFKHGIERRLQLEEDQREETQRREASLRAISQLCAEFNRDITGALQSVTGRTSELEQASTVMSTAASTSGKHSTSVVELAGVAAGNAQSIAAAVEELSASIGEIGRQAEAATGTAKDAVKHSEAASQIVGGLTEVANKVAGVLNLIRDIAGRTNLLALNATIEAARAGEAGKGFSVVAGEVKSLANQTAKATDEIEGQINAVQEAAGTAAHSITEIGSVIRQIHEAAIGISASVSRQTAATQEIARNVNQASANTLEVARIAEDVKTTAAETGHECGNVHQVAIDVSGKAVELRRQVESFLTALGEAATRDTDRSRNRTAA